MIRLLRPLLRALDGLHPRLGHEPMRVRVGTLERVDERVLFGFNGESLGFFGLTELVCTELTFALLGFVGFDKGFGVGLFALDVGFDERCVFATILCDAFLSRFDVYVVDEVEGWNVD